MCPTSWHPQLYFLNNFIKDVTNFNFTSIVQEGKSVLQQAHGELKDDEVFGHTTWLMVLNNGCIWEYNLKTNK